MTRAELEHVIRAAAAALGEEEFVVVGSQAVLGQFPDAPEALRRSMEVDVFPATDPGRAAEIDGAIGEGSAFHDTFGYYAHGVGPETTKAPAGWEGRLIPVVVERRRAGRRAVVEHPRSAVARCLEIHDLVLSKCVASREKDYEFATDALRAGLCEADLLRARLSTLPVGAEARDAVDQRVRGVLGAMRA